MVALEMAAMDSLRYLDGSSDTDKTEVAALPPEVPVVVAPQPEPPGRRPR